jgi:6-pyruvoyltetrahydropterin/6-carboxytetrahydropterin synthase
MFEVSVERTFAAGHALRGYQGKCENVHGHNYRVQVVVRGERLNSIGLLVDFVDVKRVLDNAIERLDHQFINDVPPFDQLNPSAENMAKYFFEELQEGLRQAGREVPIELAEVRLWETDNAMAVYRA